MRPDRRSSATTRRPSSLRRLGWIALAALLAASAALALVGYAPVHGAEPLPQARAAGASGLFVSGTLPLTRTQPQLLILGPIDSASQPPLVRLHISVIGPQADMVTGLGKSDLTVSEDGEPVENLKIAEEQIGIAVMVVLDRGGMTQPGVAGKRHWEDAVGLVVSLTQSLQPGTDLIGLVAADAAGQTAPTVTLTLDGQVVRGALDGVNPVAKATSLYDAVCVALDGLTSAAGGPPADLAARRKAIVILTDGLDNSSTTCTATEVRDRARRAGVTLYSIGIDTPEDKRTRNTVPLDATQIAWLAEQTGGLYFDHVDAASHAAVLEFYERLLSQRRQYLVTFNTRLARGDHQLQLSARLPEGTAEAQAAFSSTLQLPEVELTSPSSRYTITREFGVTITPPILLDINLRYPDGVARDPTRVEYLVNDQVLVTRDAPPYGGEWNPTGLASGAYAVKARVYDAWLAKLSPVESDPAFVEIIQLPPRPPDTRERILAWIQQNVLLLIGVPLVLVAAVVLLSVRRRLVAGVRETRQRLTETMPGVFGPARGRLVVTRGASAGREFRLVKPLTIIGREQALCDIALDDRYVSARHATIRLNPDGTFAITDEGSQNGTLVNGARIPPRQAIPLAWDSALRLGETELLLQRGPE